MSVQLIGEDTALFGGFWLAPCGLFNTRTGRKDKTAFRSFMRINACLASLYAFFTRTMGICFAAQCPLRSLPQLPISRAIDTSDTYFFLNFAIDCSEIRKPVRVFQPSSNLAATKPGTLSMSQRNSFATSEGVLALPFWRARSFLPNC